MQTINLKLTLFFSILICSNVLYGQTNPEVNCDIPSTYFVGAYEIEDNEATVGPTNGISNFELGTYIVTGNGTMRSFQIGLLPGFTPSAFTVELNLDCGIIQMNEIDLNLSCSANALIFTSTSDAEATTYDLIDDSSFIINYIEDPLGSCGGPYESSFRMTKVCNAPENITFSDISASTIDMDWIDPNDTINTDLTYTIEYGAQGFPLGSGTTINDISGDNYTIDNLQVDTMYDFYIWTDCSGMSTSDVLGPFSYGTFINPVFEIDTNGVTCLCADANIGDSGTITINGEQKTFTKRNRSQLEALINNDINDPEIALTCTTAILDMSYLFEDKTTFNQNILSWDVSNVNNMQAMFYNAYDFNKDIGIWDVGNVIDMSNMFYVDVSIVPPYSSFNGDLENWNVSNVTDMSNMFKNARDFNTSIDLWDVSNVNDMQGMFYNTYSFNQNISIWDVGNVINMSYMFYSDSGADYPNSSFNINIGNWDVANVTDMNHMFYNAILFNQPIGNWDVSNVTDMNNIFYRCLDFNASIDNWNVSNVNDMSYMFHSCFDFNQNITQWDVSNVTTTEGMFYNAFDFNQPIGNWNVSNVTNMSYMFFSVFTTLSYAFNQPLNNWNVSNVTTMNHMFHNAVNFNQLIENWDVSNVNDMSYLFSYCNRFNRPLNNWDVSSVTNMHSMFQLASMFNQPLEDWDVSNVTIMFSMFIYTPFNQDINSWDVSNVIRFDNMFWRNDDFNQPLNDWDVSSAVNTRSMFSEAESFNQPLNNWNFNNLNICEDMFHDAISFNQNINDWNMSNVALMKSMFWGATSFNEPLDNWDVSSVIDMRFVFKNASSFNQNITNWCVEDIPNEPTEFSLNSPLQNDFKPNWGEVCTLSLSDDDVESFKIYPNPVKGKIYIDANIIVGDLKITILDISGKVIYSQNLDSITTAIDLDFLNSGLYFLKISSANNLQIERFIKE